MPAENWTNTLLDQKRLLGDPLADEVMASIVNERGIAEAQILFDKLIRNVDMPLDAFPPIIQQYLKQTNQLPDWTDWRKVELAHELFLDHGPKFLIFLYYKSLPTLYACANGAEVLVRTSRLTHQVENIQIFTRRIAETGQFLMDVMTRGQLEAGAKGVRMIQKIRLIHASIRHFVGQNEWDEERFGKPINQEDMAVTLMTFSISLADALGQFGIEESEEKLDAFLHTWTAIGAVLGVDTDLLPANLEEARLLLDTILERQATESEAGKLLTQALIAFAKETLPSEKLDIAPEALINFLAGPELSSKLSLNKLGCLTRFIPQALASFFRFTERLEDRIDRPLHIFIDLLSQKAVKAMVNYFDNYKGRNFEIAPSLSEEWFEKNA